MSVFSRDMPQYQSDFKTLIKDYLEYGWLVGTGELSPMCNADCMIVVVSKITATLIGF